MRGWMFGDATHFGVAKGAVGSVIGAVGSAAVFFAFGNSMNVAIKFGIQAGASFIAMDVCQHAINSLVKCLRVACTAHPVIQEVGESIVRIGTQEVVMLSALQSAKYALGAYEKEDWLDDTKLFLPLMTGALAARELVRSLIVLNATRLGLDLSALTSKQKAAMMLIPLAFEVATFSAETFPQDLALGEMTVAFVGGISIKVLNYLLIQNYCAAPRTGEQESLLASSARSATTSYNTTVSVLPDADNQSTAGSFLSQGGNTL